MFASRVLSPIDPVFTTTGASARERAVDQQRFALECERWLDHWYRGSAQRARLKASLLARFGSTADPRGSDPLSNFDDDPAINDDGREIMAGTTELATVGYCRALAESLGVLYDSDDFERSYRHPDGALDEDASRVLEWYHSPSRGGLLAQLHLVDAWLPGLRTVGLLVEWEPDLEEISYQVLPPHWYTWWARPDRPCEPRLAYACAYSEAEAQDENGRPAPCPTWTCYVRPALPGDPADAPTRTPGFEDTGRLVRYRRPGHDLDQAPWPIPAPGDKSILPDPSMDGGVADGPNPLVIAGGMDDGRRVWCPIILHHSEPLVGGLRLPVADDQAQLGEELDIGLTSALHTGNTQSHGVLVITGPGDIPDRIGPSNPIHLVEGSASYIAPPGLARDHLDLLRRIAGLAGTFEHLPPDHYSDQPPSIETGPAKQLRRSELISLRSRRTVDAERPEAQRFDLERVLHNAYGVTPARPAIAWDTEQVVHWGELATPVDWSQRLQQMAQELAMGLSSTTDLLMERHGVSREEAERRVIDRAETEQRDRTSKPAAPDAPTGGQQAFTPDKGQPVEEEIDA